MAIFNAETAAPRHRFVDIPLAIRIKGKAAAFFLAQLCVSSIFGMTKELLPRRENAAQVQDR